MSRGWFLFCLIGHAILFIVGLAALGTWTEFRTALESDSVTTRGLSLIALVLTIWIMVFPFWRVLFRRRLYRRTRPLWWAGTPGVLMFAAIMPIGLVIVLRVLGVHLEDYPPAVRWIAVSLVAAPAGASLLATLFLMIECPRPDRLLDPVKVFD